MRHHHTRTPQAFTLVELLAVLAIVAVLLATVIPFIGNYVASARRTSDKQTLTILNDAATGTGNQYKFTRYGSFTDLNAEISNTLAAMGAATPADLNDFLTSAMATTGSNDYMIITNPAATANFSIDVRVASSGKKVMAYWGDGTTGTFSPSTSSNTTIAKTYSAAAARTIIMVGDISRIETYTSTVGDAAWWDAQMKGLTHLGTLIGNRPKAYTNFNFDFKDLPRSLTYLQLSCTDSTSTPDQFGLSGDVADLPRGMTNYYCWSSSSISGKVADLPRTLTSLSLTWTPNTLTGNIEDFPPNLTYLWTNASLGGDVTHLNRAFTFLYATGTTCTITGDIANLPTTLTGLGLGNNSTVYGDIANLSSSLSLFYVNGSQGNLSGDLSTLKSGCAYFGYENINGALTLNSPSLSAKIAYLRIYKFPSSTHVNNLLAALWANRDIAPGRTERSIILQGSCPAPTGQGLIDKAALQAYRTPNMDASKPLWTIQTN